MNNRVLIIGMIAIAAAGTGNVAYAQAAAEEAVILSGSAGQGKASRNLGIAIRGSLNRASQSIATTNSAPVRAQGTRQRRGANRAQAHQGIPAGVDPLKNTDASAYTLNNGATIKVSGKLNPAAGTVCTRNCPEPRVQTEGETGEVATAPKE